MVLSRIDEESLRKIAADTGGTYVRSVAGDLDLDVLYFNGIRARTTAQTLKSGKIRIEEERFVFFLLPALLFLLIEGFLAERRAFRPTVLAALLLGSFVVPGRASAAEDPDRLFRSGRFAEAEKAYADLDMDHPKDIRYRYNRGVAAYHKGDYQGAIAAFSSAISRAGDDAMRFRATYNLGNAVFQKGDFAAAADLFRNALRSNPASEDARHNLELALRKLEQPKKEQQKKDQDDKQQQKDGNGTSDAGKQGKEKGDGGNEQASRENQPDAKGGPDEKKQGEDQESGKAGGKKPQELSGELEPRTELPENAPQQDPASSAASSADRRMAEALLNNVSEDRSHLRQPGARRRGVRSGKDW
jgi:Ca-activated chloride channel family protein